MHRIIAGLGLIAVLAAPLFAESLSVAPLAGALKNPALDSDEPEDARRAVAALLWNQPDEDELDGFHRRLAVIARHRDTRVGKLFFAALEATPDVENLPGGVSRLTNTAIWPLSLGARIRVRATFLQRDDEWKIERFDVTLEGLAASPIAGMAPYFGTGEIDLDRLDFEPIDYLLGRDPEDRIKIEAERSEFDFDTAINDVFGREDGAFEKLVNELSEKVTEDVDPADRIAALAPHLATQAEVRALKRASDDPETANQFWQGIFEQIERVSNAPRPAAVPKRRDAGVELAYTIRDEHGERESSVIALRLESGEIALREEALALGIEPEDENDGS